MDFEVDSLLANLPTEGTAQNWFLGEIVQMM